MNKLVSLLGLCLLLTSCLAVKFPSKVTINVSTPTNLTEEQINTLIEEISNQINPDSIELNIDMRGNKNPFNLDTLIVKKGTV